jgi:hypothetical protein
LQCPDEPGVGCIGGNRQDFSTFPVSADIGNNQFDQRNCITFTEPCYKTVTKVNGGILSGKFRLISTGLLSLTPA